MPDVVEDNVTCSCVTKCANKKCNCKLGGNKCALLCHKSSNIRMITVKNKNN